MTRLLLLLPALLAAAPLAADVAAPEFTDVFVSGREGYPNYRIPALVVTKGGTLLALCEGRALNSDHSANDLVLKRSRDGGRTWSPLQLVRDEGDDTCNDPVMVALDTGRVLIFYVRFPAEAHTLEVASGFSGKVTRHYVMVSDDEGRTWSEPREISRQVKPPAAQATSQGAGAGLQLRQGPHAGRVLVPMWQRRILAPPAPGAKLRVSDGLTAMQQAFVAYSDDRGATWRHSAIVPDGRSADGRLHNMSEGALVELADGTVLMNGRNANGPMPMHRKVSVSRDGGATWSQCRIEEQLPEPQCQGSLLRLSDAASGRSRILFSNPNSPRGRTNGFLRLSYDETATWPIGKPLVPGVYRYSSLALLPDRTIAVLFEQGTAKTPTISLARCRLEWLTDGHDALP